MTDEQTAVLARYGLLTNDPDQVRVSARAVAAALLKAEKYNTAERATLEEDVK